MPFSLSTLSLNRDTLGLDRFPLYGVFVKWKLSDAIYVLIIYALDWVYFEKIPPFQRQFTINDITLSHPFAEHERVPGDVLLNLITFVPAILMALVSALLTPRPFKIYVIYLSILGVFISMGTCIFVTDVLKNWTGRCRPDFLARCQPKEGLLPDVLYNAVDACTTKDFAKLQDGFRTTPSGHSSMSWSAFGYVSLWLNGQLNCSHVHRGAWRSIIAFLPCLVAFYVALSRTQDYRHHFIDIILGSLLGGFIAWWSYRRYFPSLHSKGCYIPYVLLGKINQENGEFESESEQMGHDYYKDVQLAMGTYLPTATRSEDGITNNLDLENSNGYSF